MFSKIHQILNSQSDIKGIEPVRLHLNNIFYPFNKNNYVLINSPRRTTNKTLTFIDGGSAILAHGATFSLSFIRIASLTKETSNLSTNPKPIIHIREFFLLTIPKYDNNSFHFENHILEYSNSLSSNTAPLNITHLQLQTNDPNLSLSNTTSPTKMVDIARRFAELQLAIDIQTLSTNPSHLYLIDGTLTPSYPNEKSYISKLHNTCAIAKSSTLLTTTNQSINQFLNQHGPKESWVYSVTPDIHFTKLHEKSNHIFRFEGNINNLTHLLQEAKDATFPGYPYGLIRVDQIARVTNEEKRILTAKFLNHKENSIIKELLASQDSHSILDHIR